MSALAHPTEATRDEALPAPEGAYVLRVDFVAPDGRRWWALGGGRTLAQALRFARESCPSGAWRAVGWSELHGA